MFDTFVDNENDFVYCDPPYLNSIATYNEQNGWTEKDENDLRIMLDKRSQQNRKWALSNNIAVNTTLADWANEQGYRIHYVSNSYSNSNYHKKGRLNKDIEVLITNY